MEENHIKFSMEGNLSALDFMEDVDVCVLFSNLLDNAIEANMNVARLMRYIELSVRIVNKLLYIQLDNPFDDNSRNKPNKTNGDVHGIGLQNVREIVDKYEGQLGIEKDDITYSSKMCFGIK